MVRQWGRVGQRGGQQRVDHYPSYDEAMCRYETLCQLRKKHQYLQEMIRS